MLRTVVNNVVKSYGVAHAAQLLTYYMGTKECPSRLYSQHVEGDCKTSIDRPVIPGYAAQLAFKFLKRESLQRILTQKYYQALQRDDIAYVWPGSISADARELKQRCSAVAVEFINTHQSTSARLLSAEFSRLDLQVPEPVKRNLKIAVTPDCERCEGADIIFSPSPEVTQSLRENNVHENKIIESSYGFCKSAVELMQYQKKIDALRGAPKSRPIFICVGRLGIRKGVHLLLSYWKKAAPDAELWLIGNVEGPLLQVIDGFSNYDNVRHISFTNNLSAVYAQADVFILPSIEEGSPLVTYQSLAAGLPCLVSPMGGGGVVEHGYNGLLCLPHDANAWIENIELLAEQVELRQQYGAASQSKAFSYTWDKVGKHRMDDLQRLVGELKQ